MANDDMGSQGNEKFGIPSVESPSEIPTWAAADAKSEERDWTSLEKIKADNDNRWLRSYGWVVVIVTWTFAILFLASLAVWSWHYLTPWCWLSAEQLSKVQSILFSGGMGAIISSIIRTQLDKT